MSNQIQQTWFLRALHFGKATQEEIMPGKAHFYTNP